MLYNIFLSVTNYLFSVIQLLMYVLGNFLNFIVVYLSIIYRPA